MFGTRGKRLFHQTRLAARSPGRIYSTIKSEGSGGRQSDSRRKTCKLKFETADCHCLLLTLKNMAIRKITEYPEKVLAEIGKPVTVFDEELGNLCADMFETMYDAEGVGLAAQQIGLPLQLFVMDCEGVKLVAANPEIISTIGEQSGQEGCLSLGKVPAVVVRAEKATLRAQDAKGEWFEREATGYAARAFQHETDHCNGKLFIDHLPKMRRDMVVKRFTKEKRWK